MDTVNIVVQARMGSVRLPGKMMLDLYGEPILYRILQRLRKCELIDQIILATSENPLDDILAEVGSRVCEVKVVRGSEHNLVERFQKVINLFPCDFVIRFPGDNVFPDPSEIDNLIKFHIQKNRQGFSSNLASVFSNRMVDGVGAEIFSAELLKNLAYSDITAAQQEHLHLNFYDYERSVSVQETVTVLAPKPHDRLTRPEFAFDINYIEQYALIREIYREIFMVNDDAKTEDIINYLDEKRK